MDKIVHTDISKLRDFIKLYQDDTESPIVWIAQIVEKLARVEYYKTHARYAPRKSKITK